MTQLLNLVAYDEHDVLIVASHVEGAETKQTMMRYDKADNRFAMIMIRDDKMDVNSHDAIKKDSQLYRSAFVANHVLGVQQKIPPSFKADDIMELLTISVEKKCEQQRDSSCYIILFFKQDYLIRLEAECLDASLQDLELIKTIDKNNVG